VRDPTYFQFPPNAKRKHMQSIEERVLDEASAMLSFEGTYTKDKAILEDKVS